ncbi:antiholin-like murein hydrolase modulator LrgA [Clostridium sp.]|uniref:antiholin-like murein hydrolase modulator LrgA n=1 Tax=Clostridium sp. TaxID=1506 RepID=UPI0034641B76
MKEKKAYGFIMQALIFSVIMLISNLIVKVLPIPMPSSVIGMVILFLLLCTKVIKLEMVEGLGGSLTSKIEFFFVPSGISVINSLPVMEKYGVQICLTIFIATVILLGITGVFSDFILGNKNLEEASTKNNKIDLRKRKNKDSLDKSSLDKLKEVV